jgi:uncharacterized protein with FMN-binding domain
VVGATGVGLGLLLSFHTKPVHVSIVTSPTTEPTGAPGSGSTTTLPAAPTTTTPGSTAPGSTTPATTPTTEASRSATSQDLQYRYGDLQLRVTEQGARITDIQVVAEGATDPRSEEINSQAIPLLHQEAMSAQSANIDGVSGATFTSQAYAQALQAALDQLKA